jgi:Tfp pilus assembly protein PilF
MTKTLWPSAFVACLFAIHPLHVESVAWIVERKDVLSTFFWMLTMGAYSYYVEHPGFRRYFFVLLFFVLGLMSKPMLVTLPFVLLLLDYWPLRRFQEITGMNPKASFGNRFRSKLRGIIRLTLQTSLRSFSASLITTYQIPLRFAFGIGVSTIKPDHKIQTEVFKPVTSDKQEKKSKNEQAVKETLEVKKPADPEYKWSLIYPLLWEKVPLFVLAILSSIVTYVTAQSAGAVHYFKTFPLVFCIGNSFISYTAYIGKMILPSNLAVYYPYPGLLVPWQVLGSVFLLIAITSVVIWRAKKFPYLATGWLWYIGTLVPVIGIVQAGPQAMADRYTYITLIGLFIMVAWGVPELLKKWNYRKEILLASSALSILCLSIITWTQVGYWQNSITLFDHTLNVTNNNWLAYNNRGIAYADLGNYRQAIEDFNRAIETEPGNPNTYFNRGHAYYDLGNYRQAIEDYDRAIEIEPDYAMAYNNRGAAYKDLGNYRQAIEDYDRAIEIDPGFVEAFNNRAFVYLKQGDNISGCRDAQKACDLGNCKLLEAANTRGLCR